MDVAEAIKLILCLKSYKELIIGLPGGSAGKEPACQCRRHRFDPWVGKILWRRKWQPTPVFLSGKFHGQRSLVSYSPWDRKESDTTEHTRTGVKWENASIFTFLNCCFVKIQWYSIFYKVYFFKVNCKIVDHKICKKGKTQVFYIICHFKPLSVGGTDSGCTVFIAACRLLAGCGCRLLISVASPVAEHRLSGTWASAVVTSWLSSCGEQASLPQGIFLDHASNLYPLHWSFVTTGKSILNYFNSELDISLVIVKQKAVSSPYGTYKSFHSISSVFY